MKLEVVDTINSLGSAPSDIRSGRYDELHLDLENVNYIYPYQLVRWRCLIDHAINNRLQVSVSPPLGKREYAGRMGLFEGTTYVYPYNANAPTTFFPLVKITNDRNDLLYEECRRVFTLSNATTNYVDRLCDAFVELADNIYFHSGPRENSGWGYVHAQAYPRAGQIRIGISDVGAGFYGSYQRTGQLRGRSEQQILEDAFNELESCLNPAPQQGYRGIGLFEVYEFIRRNTGELKIRTGNSRIIATQNGLQTDSSPGKIDGTWIEMKAPIL